MKILQVIPNLASGGAERFTVDLCNRLSETNDNVTLLTFYDRKENDIFFSDLDNSIPTLSLSKRKGVDLKMIRNLHNKIKAVKPDVIHSHLRGLNYLMAVAPFFSSIPFIHTIHSDAFMECKSPKLRAIRKQFFRRKNVMPVTISSESAISFSAAYPKTKNTLILNGRQLPVPGPQFDEVSEEVSTYKGEDTKVFVSIGRISPEKNQLMLVQTFNRFIKEENADAILLIIGSGRKSEEGRLIEQQLNDIVSEHPKVFLLGEKTNATDYLYVSDYFCLSSVYEGMPISLIEAFATGVIPICTPVGGIPGMINELNSSLLSKSTSEEDYCQALKNAYHLSGEQKKQLQLQAKKLFEEKYSIEKCAASYEQLYRKLITDEK